MVSHGFLSKAFNSTSGVGILCALVSSFYYWALGVKQGILKRTTSHKEMADKDQ